MSPIPIQTLSAQGDRPIAGNVRLDLAGLVARAGVAHASPCTGASAVQDVVSDSVGFVNGDRPAP